jgi:hypothetical protein
MLAPDGPGFLDLIDVTGRRVDGLSFAAGPEGTRDVTLGGGLASGLYWIRFRQGDHAFTQRVVVMR